MTTVPLEPIMLVRLPARALALDDVSELAAADDAHRYELAEGNLIIRPPADAQHAVLITRLLVWFVANGDGTDRVLDAPGLQIVEKSGGRSPDVLVLRKPAPPGTVWIKPEDVLLAVEVVSPGSRELDRVIKPGEYARAGVGNFWRVERDGGRATVHMYALGSDERGEPIYLGHRAVLLDELLAAAPPHLS